MTNNQRAFWLYQRLEVMPGAICLLCDYNTENKACHYSRCEPTEMCVEGVRRALMAHKPRKADNHE